MSFLFYVLIVKITRVYTQNSKNLNLKMLKELGDYTHPKYI